MSDRITPRTLKGFRDYLPETAIPRERLIATATEVYRSFGFSPIDTPALEYSEILLGKGGDESDKQLYRFDDQGGRDIALRFDLTVPLARFVAQHVGDLGTPFKRYHVGPVWRGENTQRGRYREFMQCDFDTIGTESMVADVETALVIHDTMDRLDFERFTIRANNRKVLTGLLERLGLAGASTEVLRAIDKLPKVGPAKVATELAESAGASSEQADEILRLAAMEGTNDEIIDGLVPLLEGSETGELGLRQLRELRDGVAAAGVSDDRFRVDVSIARGLDYYTGSVFETFLDDLPDIGSVCSGGRYDDLASLYTSRRLPGVGASVGVDRLLAAMEELGLVEGTRAAAPVLLVLFDDDRRLEHIRLAAEVRREGVPIELYPDARKLGNQLKYADRRGHRWAVIVGDDEWARGVAQVKDLVAGTSEDVPLVGLGAELRDRIARPPAAGRDRGDR